MKRPGCRPFCYNFTRLCLVPLLLLCGCATSQPLISIPPPPDDLHCQPVPNLAETRLCYQQADFDYPRWFLSRGAAHHDVIVNAAGFMISSFSFSPTGSLLAVESTGEGHPLLDLYDSSHLGDDGSLTSLNYWDPYPGWISVSGWDGETLLLEADVPLHKDYDRSGDYSDRLLYHFRYSPGAEGLKFAGMEQNPDAEVLTLRPSISLMTAW